MTGPEVVMRYLFGFMCVLALGVTGCSEASGTGGSGGSAGSGGTGGECAEPSDIAGVWEITATGISDSCSGLGSYTFPVTIAQDGNALSGETPDGTLAGTVCGDRIQMSGAVPEWSSRGGTKTVDLQLTISADGNSVEGSDTWNWTSGLQSCEGSESLSGTRADEDVCDWGFGCPCERPLDEYWQGFSCPTYECALAAAEDFAQQVGDCNASFGCFSEAGLCGDFRYVRTGCNDGEDTWEYFDASGTLVAAHWWTDDCGHVCRGSCSVDYGFRPECELEQEQDFCDQND
jgi:hypothetical protein